MNAPLGPALKQHVAVNEREDRVVAAEADIHARLVLRATLANDDVAGDDDLAAVLLHAETPARGITPVARRAACFLVCHGMSAPAFRPE